MNLCADDTTVGAEVGYGASRRHTNSFETVFAEVEQVMMGACAEEQEWPAQIARGITAAIDFLAENPRAAKTLTVDSRSGAGEQSDYPAMIGRFAALLGDSAPSSQRLPASSDHSVVAVIAAIVSCHVRAGTIDSLSEGDPDLVFLALLPYAGFAEASRWSASVSR